MARKRSDDMQWPCSKCASGCAECEQDRFLVDLRRDGTAAGANMAGQIYQPHITSYDYDCPISEAGGIGQPGIGGDNKFKVLAYTHA